MNILRDHHRLSVPLAKFHEVVIEMLNRCLCGPILTPLSPIPTNYSARLNMEDGLFTVVERTHYSDVIHLSLPLIKGDDKAVQEYLAARLELSLVSGNQQSATINNLKSKLAQEKELKERSMAELHELRLDTFQTSTYRISLFSLFSILAIIFH